MPADRTSWSEEGPFGDELVERFAGDVLHDDIGFRVAGAVGTCSGLGEGLACFAQVAQTLGWSMAGGETGFAKLGSAPLLDGEIAALKGLKDYGALEEVCPWRGIRAPLPPAPILRMNS